jgi:hypothetical protein
MQLRSLFLLLAACWATCALGAQQQLKENQRACVEGVPGPVRSRRGARGSTGCPKFAMRGRGCQIKVRRAG